LKQENVTTARDREKKQLEEIAHLYFSSAGKPGKESLPRQNVPSPAPEPLARPLWICCRTGRGEESQVLSFLLNLAILFKIAGEPAVLISSDPSFYERHGRSQGVLWPRLAGRTVPGTGVPASYYVPMGIQLVVGPEKRREWDRAELSRFRYVLCDEPVGFLPVEDLHRLDILLLSPATQEAALPLRPKSERPGLSAQAGVVVVGVGNAEEGEAVLTGWGEKLDRLYCGIPKPESFGFVPGDLNGHGAGRPRIEVLENPLSRRTQCLQRIASRIRGKREEFVQRPRGNGIPNTV
jgi:hypothetical protein